MAHRILTQVLITGSRVLGTAFREAYKQASASQKYAAHAARNPNGRSALTHSSSGLTLEEACKILNVPPPKQGKIDMENVLERFKKMFDANEPKKGGSFYLQSKILRARERIEREIGERARKVEEAKEMEEGWKPKVYKDR